MTRASEGSNPFVHPNGELAHLGERLLCTQKVIGSSPIFSTIIWASGQIGKVDALKMRSSAGSSPASPTINL